MSLHSASRMPQRANGELLASNGFLRRKRACCKNSNDRAEGDLHCRQATNQSSSRIVPPIVNDVLRSPGQPLNSNTRAFMESRFNQDFSRVKVHTDASAAQSASVINARAYNVGNDIVFGEGQYQPTSEFGTRLIAHELAHVVQQNNSGNSASAEARAEKASENVTNNQMVSLKVVGGASPGLYADNGEEEGTPASSPTPTIDTQPAFSLGWTDMARMGTFQLTPPSLLRPQPARISLGSPLLSSPKSPRLSVPTLPPPILLPPSSPRVEQETEAPELPSRLPVLNRGRFSLGLRLGFPESEAINMPGMPPSALSESMQRATFMNQMLTGNVPSGWEAVDKGKLVKAIWGIFSENIAPDVARSITSSLSTPAGPAGTSYELDIVLLTDFSSEIGGGLSFTVRYPSLSSLITGRP